MAVRNFYIGVDIDGRETTLSGGPKAKDGGMQVSIHQRSDGSITTPIRISCWEDNGTLITRIWVDNILVATKETKR